MTEEEIEKIYKKHEGLVYYMYKKGNFNKELKEDLIMQGKYALWKSIKNFDATKKTKFSTYACKSIKTEMLKFVKDHYKHRTMSLDSIVLQNSDGSNVKLIEILTDNSDAYTMEERIAYTRVIEQVYEKSNNKKVIALFLEYNTQNEIAKICGISQSQVCKIIKQFKEDCRKEIER